MNPTAKEIQATKDFRRRLNPGRAVEGAVSRRAQLLADRIELGADVLASFVGGLSETEWSTPVSAADRRSIDVIVHHVASVYPIEIERAKTIASGKAVALELLPRNSAVTERVALNVHRWRGPTRATRMEILLCLN